MALELCNGRNTREFILLLESQCCIGSYISRRYFKALNTLPSINSLNLLSVLESDNKQKDNDSKNPGCPSALHFQILASLAPADEIFIAVVRFLISSRLCCLEAFTVVPCSGFHGCLSQVTMIGAICSLNSPLKAQDFKANDTLTRYKRLRTSFTDFLNCASCSQGSHLLNSTLLCPRTNRKSPFHRNFGHTTSVVSLCW